MLRNKKGVGFGSWTETILFSVGFLTILTIVIAGMNSMYHKNYSIGIGDRTNATQRLIGYQDTSSEKMTGGEVSFTSASGVTLKTSWDIITSLSSIIWDFITGGWIHDLISNMGLGQAGDVLALILQVLYFVSVVFAGLYALFRVIL
jgi:hypothetical protein